MIFKKEILDDLNSEQRLLYEYCIGIATENMLNSVGGKLENS